MTLKEEAQAALADIITDTGMGVALVIDGIAGTGLRVNESKGVSYGENGETAQTTGTVRASCATWAAKPKEEQPFLIDGAAAIVTQCDSFGALWVIQYRKARPVVEV